MQRGTGGLPTKNNKIDEKEKKNKFFACSQAKLHMRNVFEFRLLLPHRFASDRRKKGHILNWINRYWTLIENSWQFMKFSNLCAHQLVRVEQMVACICVEPNDRIGSAADMILWFLPAVIPAAEYKSMSIVSPSSEETIVFSSWAFAVDAKHQGLAWLLDKLTKFLSLVSRGTLLTFTCGTIADRRT